MKPTVFISKQSATKAAWDTAKADAMVTYCQVKRASAIAADRSRESGWIAALFDGQRRFVGYAMAEG